MGTRPERTRRLLPLLLVSVGVMTLAAGCTKRQPEPQTVVQVQAVQVRPQSISQFVTGDAILAPIAQAAISPKITAPVKRFYVIRGSKVHKGQLLVVLDNADLSAALLDSKGNYEQAQATYTTATKASIPADYQTAQLAVQQAKANLDVARKIYDSRKALFQQGAIPGRDVDTAKASLVQAQSTYDIAKARLDAFQSINQADAMESAEGALASAKGKLQGARAQLGYSEIRSPIDGVVTERPLYAGETAPAGTPLITVMNVSTLLAKTHLPQDQAQLLKVGQPAAISVGGAEKSFPGTVSMVSPALDPGSTTVEVWVKVPNKNGELKAGAAARVSIKTRTVRDTLVVPQEAVLTGPTGEHTVMVVDSDNVAHQRDVRTGITDHGKVQVVSGLQSGDTVVTNGAYAMADGTKVKIVPGGSESGRPSASDSGGGD